VKHLWFDVDGNPVSIAEAGRLLCSRERIIAQEIIGGMFVSTVHLVLDHSFADTGPPLIFETMAFKGFRVGSESCGAWRTPTKHAALACHDRVCAAIRDGALDRLDDDTTDLSP
jgi:hypothetical protein